MKYFIVADQDRFVEYAKEKGLSPFDVFQYISLEKAENDALFNNSRGVKTTVVNLEK